MTVVCQVKKRHGMQVWIRLMGKFLIKVPAGFVENAFLWCRMGCWSALKAPVKTAGFGECRFHTLKAQRAAAAISQASL
jgi:hypothetical protein